MKRNHHPEALEMIGRIEQRREVVTFARLAGEPSGQPPAVPPTLRAAAKLDHLVAQQVLHHCIGMTIDRAERQAADGTHELLELAGDAGIDGPVAGIVYARGNFVGGESPVEESQVIKPAAEMVGIR